MRLSFNIVLEGSTVVEMATPATVCWLFRDGNTGQSVLAV